MSEYTRVFLIFSLLVGAQEVAAADCWELIDKDGRTILATDIWHIKNRLGQGGALMGKMDGEEMAIPVADIRAMTLAPQAKGWMPFMGGHAMSGEITFTDERKGLFESDLNLHLLKDDKKDSLSLADVRSITRCDAEVSAKTSSGGREKTTAPILDKQTGSGDMDSVRLINGDILNGTVTTSDFKWEAPYASLAFKREQIQAITLRSNEKHNGLLELRSGDRISGILMDKYIEITLEYGQRVPLATEMLESVHFRKPASGQ